MPFKSTILLPKTLSRYEEWLNKRGRKLPYVVDSLHSCYARPAAYVTALSFT